jgi:PAS domain S-box-containing protein
VTTLKLQDTTDLSERSSDWPRKGGQVGHLIRCFDWSATPLGPICAWPQSLKTATDILLQSPVPIVLLWGEDGIMIYNDAYSVFAGRRHPRLLGSKVREGWAEIADFNDNVMKVGLAGQTLSYEDQELTLLRHGVPEQVWMNLNYSPVMDESGKPGGVIAIVVETTAKVNTERALRTSEAQFRSFAQAVPNHVWTASPDGALDWFNERVYEYSGAAHGTLDGARWASIVHPEDVALAASRWSQATATGAVYETEFRIRRADGSYRWHLVRSVPIKGEDGAILRWVGTNTDIDERRAAADALAHLNATLAEQVAQRTADRDRMWRLSTDFMLVADYQANVTAVNPAWTATFGWLDTDLDGRNFMSLVHPDDVAATLAEVGRLAEGQTTLRFENRYRAKDGDYRLISWTAVPEAGHIHAVGRDITEERKAARERDRSWEISPVLKVVVDRAGIVLTINPSWTRILGFTQQEVVGRPVTDFMAPEDARLSDERRARLIAGEVLSEYEAVFLDKDGAPHRLRWKTVYESDAIYAFGRDITAEHAAAEALKQTEEALRQSQKMEAVGQLTGGIAHDFNNLLTGITGSLELLAARIAQGRVGEADRYLTAAQGAARRAASLTHRLLAFSRRQTLDPKPTDVNRLIAGMTELVRRTVGPSIEIENVAAVGLWSTLVDQGQLENALLNLCINARDAMPNGGRITIETANRWMDRAATESHDLPPGQYISLCVSDTGVGMTPDVVARAFDPFFTTKPLGQGTGLGLSMIYGFARQSGGHVRIYSEPGHGTAVRLYLPRHYGDAAMPDEAPQRAGALRAHDGETVLVVDDEPSIRMLVAETLEDLGYNAIEAADGPSGLRVLQSDARVDLLVTDVGLPGSMNGRQMADAGRLKRPNLNVLFITGFAENAVLGSNHLEPGMHILTKPFAMETLASRIKQLISP